MDGQHHLSEAVAVPRDGQGYLALMIDRVLQAYGAARSERGQKPHQQHDDCREGQALDDATDDGQPLRQSPADEHEAAPADSCQECGGISDGEVLEQGQMMAVLVFGMVAASRVWLCVWRIMSRIEALVLQAKE